jgi:hypothetical protein
MCGALSRVQPRSRIAGVVAKRSAHAGVRGGANDESLCSAGRRGRDDRHDKRRSSLTTITFANVTASALLTKMQFFADAPLLPNMRMQM